MYLLHMPKLVFCVPASAQRRFDFTNWVLTSTPTTGPSGFGYSWRKIYRGEFCIVRIAVWAGFCTAFALPAPAQAAMSYHQQIAPILAKYCAPCHRPGQSGPFPLADLRGRPKARRRKSPP